MCREPGTESVNRDGHCDIFRSECRQSEMFHAMRSVHRYYDLIIHSWARNVTEGAKYSTEFESVPGKRTDPWNVGAGLKAKVLRQLLTQVGFPFLHLSGQ